MNALLEHSQPIAMALIFLRLATATLLASSTSALSGIPLRQRIGAALGFALLLVPLVPQPQLVATVTSDLPVLALSELLCGALFGFGVRLWLVGADLCAQLFGQTSGLGMMVFSRAGSAAAPLAQFLRVVWVCVFFVVGGHRTAIDSLLASFHVTPLGGLVYNAETFSATAKLLGVSFALGLQAGLPIIAALLLTMVVALLLARMIPQIHVFATSTGLGALVLVAALWIGCGPLFRSLEGQVGVFLSALSKGVLGN